MKDNTNSVESPINSDLDQLIEIQKDLETCFDLIGINYKDQLETIKSSSLDTKKFRLKKIKLLLLNLSNKLKNINTSFLTYMEFGMIVKEIIPLIETLLSFLPSNLSQLYLESHRLLKLYWGIRFVLARFALEKCPEFYKNQIQFFNLPDTLFTFIEKLKKQPLPIRILTELDSKLQHDERFPLLIDKTKNHIVLSPLGEKLLTAHTIANYYYYYLYDFEEDVLDELDKE
ncbi:MAG: hypothetical protein ACTSYB_14040 [Candidatus Helarchaeota archaeon]